MALVEQPDIITAAEDHVRHIFEQKIPSDIYTYHNWVHTTQVRDEVLVLARQAGVTNGELEMLNLAALFHDVGFSEAYSGHEDRSIKIATEFLSSQNYPRERIDAIVRFIEVTKIDVLPKTKLESLMKDADTSSLGKSHFQIYTNSLRKELNTLQNTVLSKKDWAKTNLRFLDEHEYYSDAGKERYAEKKAENRRLLVNELTQIDVKPEEKDKVLKPKKEDRAKTIANSKSAQNQFKTALRNHIGLSQMADNKANNMVSINGLIIGFALPLLGRQIADNKYLLVPTVMLLIVTLTSMVFAILATRPIRMKGLSSMDSILSKKSNLFFFGNYFKMTYDDYETGMIATIADDDILNSTIMRDLFFLGKSLGIKYAYLRYCYNIFMFGVISTVIAFIIVFAFF
ncbi:MAG TPA: Pycsar system effector family protein [Saprospiraceae bacterium]|nr:Pycsar system effector family protein [Saprospiraceae bacterium]